MRTYIILFTIFLVSMVYSSPVEYVREHANIPGMHYAYLRSMPQKEAKPGVKGYPTSLPNVRKGEYICGNRICKLKPGEIPKGCNGVCQYPI